MTDPVISAQMALCHAMRTVFLATPPLADGNVVANRRRPMAAAVDRQIFVYLQDSLPARGAIRGAPVDWRTTIRVECLARDSGPVDADVAADAMAVEVYARVLADPSLGGLAFDLEPSAMGCTGDEADTSLSATQFLFTVSHTTSENTIASA